MRLVTQFLYNKSGFVEKRNDAKKFFSSDSQENSPSYLGRDHCSRIIQKP